MLTSIWTKRIKSLKLDARFVKSLLAPSRSGMQRMPQLCEGYIKETNPGFSTYHDSMKSQTKCIYLTGQMKASKHINLQL